LDAYAAANNGQLPRPRNAEDAAKVLKFAQDINEKMPEATKVLF
jgi:hypothetical protein